MTRQVLIPQTSAALDAWVRLLRSHASARRILSTGLSDDHELSINEYECLLRLSHADQNAMRRIDLSEALLLTPSGVTRLLEGLEAAGFVEKGTCDTDARVTYAVLTDLGRRKIEEASRTHLAQVEDLFDAHYSPEEQATLAELLGRLSGDVDVSECNPG